MKIDLKEFLNVIFLILISLVIVMVIFVSCGYKEKPRLIPEVDLVQINKKVKTINAGGCGYFALKLYNKLNKDDYELIQVNDLAHVLLREKETDLFIDSRGYHTEFGIRLYYGNDIILSTISECDLKRWVDSCGLWNPSFDRKDTTIINAFIRNL